MERSCSLCPLLPIGKRLRGKTVPLCDDRSSPSLYLSSPFYDMQAIDDETDVVNRESVRSRNTIDIEALILKSVREEVAVELASLTAEMKGSLYQASYGPIRCRFCPFRAFTKASQAHRHITLYHLGKSFYVCSGKKQQRAIALYDSDYLSGVQPFELLARSAMFIRQSVTG